MTLGERGETRQGPENLGSNLPKRGLFDRLFRRAPSLIPPKPEREPVADLIARMPLPQRDVSLADINLYNTLPLDFAAMRRLGLAVNRLKATPIERFDIQHLKPDESVYAGIPMVASVIANQFHPEIEPIYPTEEEVRAMKPWLRDVSSFLGKFSQTWQRKFGGYVERIGEEQVKRKAQGISKPIEALGSVKSPQDQFVQEVKSFYNVLAKPEYGIEEGFFTTTRTKRPIEDKIPYFLSNLRNLRDSQNDNWSRSLAKKYPITGTVLPLVKFPTDDFIRNNGEEVAVAGSEVAKGIEEFLRGQGVPDIYSAPEPVRAFDFWDFDTWGVDNVTRSFAETYFAHQLRTVVLELPNILREAKNVLPESGPGLLKAVDGLAVNILILSKQGVSNAEIAAALFAKNPKPAKQG